MTPEELTEIRARHTERQKRCRRCGQKWPCDVVRLLDALQEAEAERDWWKSHADRRMEWLVFFEGQHKAEYERVVAALRQAGEERHYLNGMHAGPFSDCPAHQCVKVRAVLAGLQDEHSSASRAPKEER